MGKRIVEITQTALGDMEGIYDYYSRCSSGTGECAEW